MCTYTKRKPKLMVADKDIVTYKYVSIRRKSYLFGLIKVIKKYTGIFSHFEYEPNKTYTTTLDPFREGIDEEEWKSGSGFYSYASKNTCRNVKCIIPKGSHYYKCKDTYDHLMIYHSDKIKLVSPLYKLK